MYEFGDLYVTNLGLPRAEAAYPMRTWLAEGHMPSASSDCPVSTVDPFINLYTMLTRRTNRGTVLGADEALSLEEALHCYTWCGAYSQFAEARRGTLQPGMDADIAVLSEDLFSLAPDALAERVRGIACDLTLVGGAVTHDRHSALAEA
jgi:predicted amidohydrolase YtcJ